LQETKGEEEGTVSEKETSDNEKAGHDIGVL